MRLKDKFNVKTKAVKEHQPDTTYYVECPEENCNENHVEETGRRLLKRVIDHNGRDKNSHIFKHLVEREHKSPSLQQFSIMGGSYRKNKFHRKAAESLLVKETRSTLNTQESIPLELFN